MGLDVPKFAYVHSKMEFTFFEFTHNHSHLGLYRYKQLPFGSSSAPVMFQKIVEKVIQRIPGTANYVLR